jgi:hypothetical protein
MSVDNPNTTTDSIDPMTTADPQPFMGSELLTDSDITEKQRRVLLATSAFAGRHDVSFYGIAQHADVSTNYVRYVLVQFIDRHDLPAACRVLERCTPTKTYDDLTSMQRNIINELLVNPEQTDREIAEIVGCSNSHVQHTRIIYGDMVDERRQKVCA